MNLAPCEWRDAALKLCPPAQRANSLQRASTFSSIPSPSTQRQTDTHGPAKPKTRKATCVEWRPSVLVYNWYFSKGLRGRRLHFSRTHNSELLAAVFFFAPSPCLGCSAALSVAFKIGKNSLSEKLCMMDTMLSPPTYSPSNTHLFLEVGGRDSPETDTAKFVCGALWPACLPPSHPPPPFPMEETHKDITSC